MFLKRVNLTKFTLLTLLHYVVSRVVKMASRVVKMASRVGTHSADSTPLRHFFIFPAISLNIFFVQCELRFY